MLIYSNLVSLFFSIISENIDVFVKSRHDFNNSAVVEVGILHSQPFANSSFHFLVIVESMATRVASGIKQVVFRRGKVRAIKVDGREFNARTTTSALVSIVCCVEFQGRAEYLHLATGVQVRISRSLASPLHTSLLCSRVHHV